MSTHDQTKGELCEKCGWAMKFPEEPCRCELERENAALRAERVLVSVHTGKFTTISGRAMICPDCGRALLHEDRAVIDAAQKEVQP